MSETSVRLSLPYLQPAQAQKHVTHNEALAQLDLLVQLSVAAFEALDPPATPQPGQIFALGPNPAGLWAGQGGRLAAWQNGAWVFIAPAPGWRAALGAELRLWDGSAWVVPAPGPLQNLPGIGLNTSHDATNRLAISAPATLLSHEGAGHQLKINKATAPDTASLLFQTGWQGRAEIGLSGSDGLEIKVSADGAQWQTALGFDPETGLATGTAIAQSPLDTLAGRLLRMGAGHAQLDPTLYRQGNVLGAVAQAAGQPAGALLERGSTAAGQFLRLACGTQLCWGQGAGLATGPASWTYPAAFATPPQVLLAPSWAGGTCLAGLDSVTASAAQFSVRNLSDTRIARACGLFAIGSWL